MRPLRWALAGALLCALMIAIGVVLAFVLRATSFLVLVVGAVVAVLACLGLIAVDPNTDAPGPDGSANTSWPPPAEAPHFAAELTRMLERVAPRRLDRERSELSGAAGTYLLAHDRRPEWDIDVTLDPDEIVVAAAGAHEHFMAWASGPEDPRPWTVEAVDFVAELFRGEIVVRRCYRGRWLTRIEHGRYEGGVFRAHGWTVRLTPAALLPLARRTEVERPDFETLR
jgi:hypothetical protein